MANQLLTTTAYDSKKVKLIIGGATVSGFTEGTKLTITKETPLTETLVGVDNDQSVSVISNTSGTLTFNLQNTAPWNGILELQAFQGAQTGKIFFPVVMEDPSGSSLLSTHGWLEVQPDYSASQGVDSRSWVIRLQNATTMPTVETAAIQGVIATSTF